MTYGYSTDPEVDRSTNRVMAWAVGLTLAMAAVFPLYLWYEPGAREDNRAEQLASLADEGESIWSFNCAACHGAAGEGGIGPALNSRQFLQPVTNDQIQQLVAVGIPGSTMSAYSQDFGGPLTSEQIKAVTTFVRSWEETAPDNPNWRTPQATDAAATSEGAAAPADEAAADGDVELTGRELYDLNCSSCHAADLSGATGFPAIGPGSEAADDSDGRIVRRITDGGTTMPAFGDSLTAEQIDSILGYLREVQATAG